MVIFGSSSVYCLQAESTEVVRKSIVFGVELLDFPKGSHDDTIDAFWLSTQYAKGNKKAGKAKKVKNRKNEWEKPKKKYNWVTGARY